MSGIGPAPPWSGAGPVLRESTAPAARFNINQAPTALTLAHPLSHVVAAAKAIVRRAPPHHFSM
jgi:hypothetical protein